MSKIEDFNTQVKKTVTAKDLKAPVKKQTIKRLMIENLHFLRRDNYGD